MTFGSPFRCTFFCLTNSIKTREPKKGDDDKDKRIEATNEKKRMYNKVHALHKNEAWANFARFLRMFFVPVSFVV